MQGILAAGSGVGGHQVGILTSSFMQLLRDVLVSLGDGHVNQRGVMAQPWIHPQQQPDHVLVADTDRHVQGRLVSLVSPPQRLRHPAVAGVQPQQRGTDTDTCIGIGRIRIRGYGNFLKNPIRGYVYYLKK